MPQTYLWNNPTNAATLDAKNDVPSSRRLGLYNQCGVLGAQDTIAHAKEVRVWLIGLPKDLNASFTKLMTTYGSVPWASS